MSLISVFYQKGLIFRVGLFCSMFLFTACANASKQESIRLEQQKLYSTMAQIVGESSCSTSADCGVVPVGSMACGGPASYMAYGISISDDKIAELKELAERTKELDKKLNQKSGLMSTCVFQPEPALVCENNRCATSNEPSIQ